MWAGRAKTTAALLGLLLLGWVSGYDRLPIALLVCLCRILGLRQLKPLAMVTVLVLLVAKPFSGMVSSIDLILRAKYGETLLDLPAVKYFGLLGRMLGGYLLYRCVSKLGRGARLVALHVGALVLLLGCDRLLQLGPVWGAVVIYGLMSFSFFFHYLCYIALENPSLSAAKFCTQYVALFWENSTSPRPTMALTTDPDPEGLLTMRCMKSALSASLLIVTGGLVQAFLYGTPFAGISLPISISPLPNVTTLGPTTSLFLVYPRWQIGLSILWAGFYRVSNYFALFVFIECCHLILGQDVPSRFVFPLRVRSFGEFYNCIMPYYVVVVNRIYLYPYYSMLRKRGWNRARAYDFALFGAIFSAGFVTHCMRDAQIVALVGAKEFLWRSLLTDASYLPLLFLAIRFAKLPRFLEDRLPWFLSFLMFLSVYSLVIFFRVGGLFVSFDDRLKFLCTFLLGGAW